MRKLGEFTLDRVVESETPLMERANFFPQSDAETFAEHAHWLQPRHVDPVTGKLTICVQSYVVRTPRHVIPVDACVGDDKRSEEHTSELQSLMRISYAVFCLKKKTNQAPTTQILDTS